jgi:hypothetical protein
MLYKGGADNAAIAVTKDIVFYSNCCRHRYSFLQQTCKCKDTVFTGKHRIRDIIFAAKYK